MMIESTLPPVHVARRLFLVQVSPVLLTSLFAAWLAQSSQGGGISPAAALLCPLLGPLGAVVVEPNRLDLDELPLLAWVLIIASMVAIAWLMERPHRAKRRGSMVAWGAASFIANGLWSLAGIARVGHSMM